MRGLFIRGASSLAMLLAGNAAQAQLLPPDQSLVQFNRYTAVRERAIPGNTPLSIPVGNFSLLPSLDVLGNYTDNIYALETPRVSDEFVEIAPAATLQSNGTTTLLSLSANARIDRYATHTSENTEDVDSSAYLVQQLGSSTRFRLIGRFHDGREARDSQNVYVLTERPIRYETATAAVGVSQQFASVLLSGEGGYQRSTYSNAALFDGTPIDQTYRNNDVYTLRVRAEVAQSPSLAYFAQATRQWIDYSINGDGRGVRNLELLGGVRFELPVRARGEIGVGYVQADFDSQVPRFSGLGINSKVTFFPTDLITVTVNAQRSLNDAGTPNSTGYVALSGGAQVDYELLRSLILGAGLQLERDTFNGIDRHDGRVAGSASVEYRFHGGWALHGSYDILDISSKGIDQYKSFTRNRLLVGLRFFL